MYFRICFDINQSLRYDAQAILPFPQSKANELCYWSCEFNTVKGTKSLKSFQMKGQRPEWEGFHEGHDQWLQGCDNTCHFCVIKSRDWRALTATPLLCKRGATRQIERGSSTEGQCCDGELCCRSNDAAALSKAGMDDPSVSRSFIIAHTTQAFTHSYWPTNMLNKGNWSKTPLLFTWVNINNNQVFF